MILTRVVSLDDLCCRFILLADPRLQDPCDSFYTIWVEAFLLLGEICSEIFFIDHSYSFNWCTNTYKCSCKAEYGFYSISNS